MKDSYRAPRPKPPHGSAWKVACAEPIGRDNKASHPISTAPAGIIPRLTPSSRDHRRGASSLPRKEPTHAVVHGRACGMKTSRPNPLTTTMGTYRRPSTLVVLYTINGMDIAIRRAEYLFHDYEERQARSEQRIADSDAIAQQIDWLWESREDAPGAEDKLMIDDLAEYLLSLQLEILKEQRLDKTKAPLLPAIRQILYVPVVYALSVLRNIILLILCWIALIAILVGILRAI